MKQITRNLIYLLILLVCISLNVAVLVNGRKADCSQCVVNFKNLNKFGIVAARQGYEVTLNALAGNLSEGQCLIKWDRTEGYYVGG